MQLTTRQIIIVFAVIVVLGGGYFIFSSGLKKNSAPPAVNLVIWGTEPASNFDGILQQYKTLRPNVTLTYTRLESEGYESKIINALASGRGPDVFMISNHNLPKEKDKLAKVDPTQFNITALREQFPTVVEQDSVSGGDVYALPLSIDTLGLIYNRDMLDAAGVVSPPKTWSEFQEDVQTLRSIDENGRIVTAGAAIGGTSASVTNAPDILYALMLQNGVKMTDSDFSTATFSSKAGSDALDFYTRFGDSGSGYYTWTDNLGSDIEAMVNGKAAMMLGYYSDFRSLKKTGPFMNFAAAPLPQQESEGAKQVTFANYKELVVSKQSTSTSWGWDFIIFAATNNDSAEAYEKISGNPPALRASIQKVLSNPDYGVFSKQALIARTWHEADSVQIGKIFDTMIQDVLSGRFDSSRALRTAAEKVGSLMRTQ